MHPGQMELCNTRDDNCDGKTNEGFEKVGEQCGTGPTCQTWACDAQGAMSCQGVIPQWYRDQDGDGEGDPQQGLSQCSHPAGYVNNSFDCDDTRKERYRAAVELCNGVNDNCDGLIDEGFNTGSSCVGELGCGGTIACATTTQATCKVVTSTWYPDGDKDGHGATGTGITLCGTTPPGSYYVTSSDDCDDTKSNVYTGAPELCDTLDNNCDNQKDEGFDVGGACTDEYQCASTKECSTDGKSSLCISSTPPTQYYADNDSDQYGDNNSVIKTCGQPSAGYVTQGGDCNDGNPFTHPNAAELCDKEDNDCDAATAETSVCPTGGAKWADYSSTGADTGVPWRSMGTEACGSLAVTSSTSSSLGERILMISAPVRRVLTCTPLPRLPVQGMPCSEGMLDSRRGTFQAP
ncbi:putative metal-binding motif-containing protein [Cystobacter fuscus]